MKTFRGFPAWIAGAVLCALPALGQVAAAPEQHLAGTLGDAIAGKLVPLTITVKEMDREWRQVTISPRQGGADSILTMMMSSGRMGATDSSYFTRGQVLTLDGEGYLVTYSQPKKSPSKEDFENNDGDGNPYRAMMLNTVEPLTEDTALTLSLMNLRAMTNLLNIRPLEIDKELQKNKELVKAMNEQKRKASIQRSYSNVRQLASAIRMYMGDNNEKIPPMKDYEVFKAAVQNYAGNEKLFTNPMNDKPYLLNQALDGADAKAIKQPQYTVVIYEDEVGPDNLRSVGYLNGNAERVTAERWERLKVRNGIK